jgi:hypothetical protein
MESTKPTLNEAENGNKSKPLLPAVLYPELKDMENAVLTLENGILFSALTPMLTKDEDKEFCLLLYKYLVILP